MTITLWPIHMIALAVQVRHIRLLGPASGTFKAVAGPAGRRRPLLTMTGLAVGLIYMAGLLALAATAVLSVPMPSSTAAVVLLIAVVVPWGAVLVDAMRKHREDALGLRQPRSLAGRSTELAATGGSGYVLTDFVAAHDDTGAGVKLIESLKAEWLVDGAVIVLYAATDDLVRYYSRLGAVEDIPGERRMIFDFRSDRPGALG